MGALMSAPKIYRLSERPVPRRPRWIVEGLIAESDLVALVGAPGAGKSALVAHLAARVTTGGEFLGRRVLGPADVFYVAAERAGLVMRRLNAESADAERVIMTALSPTPSELLELADEVQSISPDPKLMVIDTLARCLVGLDENSSRDMGTAMRGIDQFRARFPTAATVLVHHVTSSTNAMRGSTALLGAVDSELVVSNERSRRYLQVRKANDGPEGIRLPFQIAGDEVGTVHPASMPDADRPSQREPDGLNRNDKRLLDLIPPGTNDRSEIMAKADAAGLIGRDADAKSERFRKRLKALRERGEIDYSPHEITRPLPAPHVPSNHPSS